MKLECDKLFRVEGHEIDDGTNEVLIEHISLIVHAPNIEKACQYARNQFVMGTILTITKCEQLKCG